MNYKFGGIISALIFSSIILFESIAIAEGLTDNKILLSQEILDLFKITITDNSTGKI